MELEAQARIKVREWGLWSRVAGRVYDSRHEEVQPNDCLVLSQIVRKRNTKMHSMVFSLHSHSHN